MTSKKKQVRFRDSSLINNDVLRPWTIDLNLDRRLQQESFALDKILAFTTPQKFAGTLASSVLDHPPDEFKEFQSTLDQKIRGKSLTDSLDQQQQLSVQGVGANANNGSGNNSNRNSDSSRFKSNVSDRGLGSGRQSGTQTPVTESFSDCFDAADLAYIERIKSNMYSRSMRSTRARTAYAAPLQSIRYSQQPFGPISPTKSKLMLTTYHNPKLNPVISHSKIPIIKEHIGKSGIGTPHKHAF